MRLNGYIKPGQAAATLTGRLREFSTERVHTHLFHQALNIFEGVSLLEDEHKREPLYGNMCALIPAGVPHRTVVIGTAVRYQSVYFNLDIGEPMEDIKVFRMSGLSAALFSRLASDKTQKFSEGTAAECLNLFLKILQEDLHNTPAVMQMPRPVSGDCRKLTEFMEKNYMNKIDMNMFRSVLPYSTRHIARIFTAEMKITLFEYLRLYRIFRASVMLHDTIKPVLRVALDCGYESVSNFYSDFNKYHSATPNEFRRMVRVDI